MHRSYIVNTKRIDAVEDHILGFGKHEVPVSESEYRRFYHGLPRHRSPCAAGPLFCRGQFVGQPRQHPVHQCHQLGYQRRPFSSSQAYWSSFQYGHGSSGIGYAQRQQLSLMWWASSATFAQFCTKAASCICARLPGVFARKEQDNAGHEILPPVRHGAQFGQVVGRPHSARRRRYAFCGKVFLLVG